MKIGLYGFGSINRLLAKYAVELGYDIVGVVDIDERIVGVDIGDIIGLGEKYGVVVSRNPDVLVGSDIVYHATSSYLDKTYDQIMSIVTRGLNVISTCETLAYPYYRYPILARWIDEKAKQYGVSVLGTGINPGFILDTLVVILSSTNPYIKRVVATRSLDAAKRREAFRKKIGVGETPEIVSKKLESGEYTGHVGYAESVYLISEAAGLQLTRVVEYQEPVVAENDISSNNVRVAKGRTRGIRGWASGYVGNREVIRVELNALVGADEYDEVLIETSDDVVKWRSSGVHGDKGTVSIMLNIGEKLWRYPPGLLTMVDIIPFRIRFRI
uniref:Dihydrodipicolinate reductase n=1 Tax=Staphylothermus marinus TaxID=2280 RepID=A0A7C4JMD0_STAMA